MLGKEKGKAISQSKRQEAVVRTATHGKWQGGARRSSMHGKVLGKEQWQVARPGKERIKPWLGARQGER